MKKILIALALLCAGLDSAAQPAEVVAKLIRATERLQVRSRQLDSIVVAITGSSTDRQSPTAKAVYDYVQAYSAGHVIMEGDTPMAQKDSLEFQSNSSIVFGASNTSTRTVVDATIEASAVGAAEIASGAVGNSELAANAVDSSKICAGCVSVTDLGQHSAASGNVLKWNGTQWAPGSDNAATLGNLTAASSKVTITGGTGAVIGAGSTVDVNETNLTINDIPDKQIAFGNSGSDGITSDWDIKVNTPISSGTINKTFGLRVEANGASGVVVDSLPAAGYGLSVTSFDATSSDVYASYFIRESAGVGGDMKMMLRNRNGTSGSDSQLDIMSDDNGGDARIALSTGSPTSCVIGRDNNDSDAFKIANSLASTTTDLTTSYAIVVNTSDEVGIKGPAASSRALTVNGSMRITASAGSPTTILGRNASNDVGTVSLGTGLTMSSGSITPDLDLAGIEGLSTNGIAARTGTSTWATRTITAPAAGISVSNGDGVSGNPTLSLANDLSAVEGLSGTGIAARTATDTWTTRTITAGTGISVADGSGVSGNPTVSVDSSVTNNLLPHGTNTWTARHNGSAWVADSMLRNDGTQIGIGVAPSSSYKLYVKQTGATNSTNGIGVERSGSTNIAAIYHNGAATFESIGGNNLTLKTASGSILLFQPGGGAGQIRQISITPTANVTSVENNASLVGMTGTFAPTASGGDFSIFNAEMSINQTGSANGITRGMKISPTLTAVTGGFRGVDYIPSTQTFLYQSSGTGVASHLIGDVGIGTGTTTPAAKLDIVGDGATSGTDAIIVKNSTPTTILRTRNDGLTIGTAFAVDNTAPSISFGTAAGTGPSNDICNGGQNGFQLYFTTGTSPATNASIFTATLPKSFPNGCAVTFSPGSAATLAVLGGLYISGTGNNSLTLSTTGTLTASTQYVLHFTITGY